MAERESQAPRRTYAPLCATMRHLCATHAPHCPIFASARRSCAAASPGAAAARRRGPGANRWPRAGGGPGLLARITKRTQEPRNPGISGADGGVPARLRAAPPARARIPTVAWTSEHEANKSWLTLRQHAKRQLKSRPTRACAGVAPQPKNPERTQTPQES
jgi:hypothetical protein